MGPDANEDHMRLEAITAKKVASPIEEANMAQDEAIRMLEKAVEALEMKLDPVLTPVEPIDGPIKDEADAPSLGNSPAVRSLREKTRRIQIATRQLNRLIGNLEI